MTDSILGPTDVLRVRLYVAGDSPNSVAATANLRRVLATLPPERVDLVIVDLLADPERSLRDGVLMTPMLVRVSPAPERRMLGNLRDHERVRAILGLASASPPV